MTSENQEKIQSLTDAALGQLSAALSAGKSDALKHYLLVLSRFHRYSFRNQLFIAFQRPDATFVAGFTAWKTKFGRFVKKGEKGIFIVAPVLRKTNGSHDSDVATDKEESLVSVRAAYVFDVSQTEGKPLPELAKVSGDPSAYSQKLLDLIAQRGIALTWEQSLAGALGCSLGNHIKVLKGLEPATEFRVLVHELAHELLHRGERRNDTTKKIRETEAEAVAYAVSTAIGLDPSSASSDYIQLYRGDAQTLTESLQFIRNVSAEIIGALVPN